MVINDFIISEQVQYDVANNNKPIIIAPISVLQPMYIPTAINVGFSVGLTDVESGNIELKVFNLLEPDKPLIVAGPISISNQLLSDKLPPKYREIRVSGEIKNLELKNEGEYKFVLYKDGTEIYSRNILAYPTKTVS